MDSDKEINQLYVKYKQIPNYNIKKKDFISDKQKHLFELILDKTKLSIIEKLKLRKLVANLSKKQFAILIMKYNYSMSSFCYKLNKFSVRVNEKVIINTPEFQIGYQKNGKGINNTIFFIKFYNFLMIDYDNISYTNLIKNLKKVENIFKFIIFQTDNGYHVFIISHLLIFNSTFHMTLMRELGCDERYIFFTYKNGYKCRLSPKKNFKKVINHKYIGIFGKGIVNPLCLQYLYIMIEVSKLFLL